MPRPRKIGVLTFHRCINYGSYWQARCLVEGLRARGADAVLLDYESPTADRAEWRCALRPHQPNPTRAEDRPAYARKARRFFEAFARLPTSRRFRLDDPEQMEGCEVVVVGSDEVWNLRHPWYGGHPVFFGRGVRAERLVSYAASCGNYDAAEGLDPALSDGLRRFAAISVRDENSSRLVERALDAQPALVLDPCLQFPPAVDGAGQTQEDGFVAVYGHSFPDWMGQGVRRWSRARGLKLVSIGYRNDWADEQRIDIGPEEFARLMRQAAGVATNFFHGCVFALLNAKPFACAATPYRSNKLQSLTATVGAQDHLVWEETPASVYDEILREPLDDHVGARIEALRRQSNGYLDQALA